MSGCKVAFRKLILATIRVYLWQILAIADHFEYRPFHPRLFSVLDYGANLIELSNLSQGAEVAFYPNEDFHVAKLGSAIFGMVENNGKCGKN